MANGHYILTEKDKQKLLAKLVPSSSAAATTHVESISPVTSTEPPYSNTVTTGATVTVEDTGFSKLELDNLLAPFTSPEQIGEAEEIQKNKFGFLEDPIDLLHFIDPLFNKSRAEGGRELYDWQIEELLRCSDSSYSAAQPLVLNICAANGSGKDCYVIALYAAWHCLKYVRSRCVITSASFKQIDKQTEPYIRTICSAFNQKCIDYGIIKEGRALIAKKGHIICPETRSEIVLFVTDDPEKAEGYHPWPDSPSQKMAIIVNEAKSVLPEIYTALNKCTGYTSWIEISSAGQKTGDFYEHCVRAIQYPKEFIKGRRYFRRVTAHDCPAHISKQELEDKQRELPREEFEAIYLSMFTSLGSKLVIDKDNLDNLFTAISENRVPFDEDHKQAAGLDLSLGGDETVLTWRVGNRQENLSVCRIKDAVALATYLDSELLRIRFTRNTYNKDGSVNLGTPIYTDIGGLGAPIAHLLESKLWNIQYVLNNSPAIQKRLYANRVAEDWFNLRNAINRGSVILYNDELTRTQLCNRKYDNPERIRLESKEECSKSPDRGDSLVLCFCDYVPKVVVKERGARIEAANQATQQNYSRITQNDLVKLMDNERFSGLQQKDALGPTRDGWLRQLITEHNASIKKN